MPSLFVAVGHNGQRLVSENGSDWKHLQLGKEGETYRAVAAGLGRYIAVGSYGGENILAVTTDGATWQTLKKEAKYVKYLRGLGFGNGMFVGIGGDPGSVGSSKPFVSTSTDGLVWSEFTEIPGKHILRRIAWGNGRWVGVGDRGRRSTSADGKIWQDPPDTNEIWLTKHWAIRAADRVYQISHLLHGRLSGFSTQRLIDFLNALGQDVEIVVRAAPRSRKRGRLHVAAA